MGEPRSKRQCCTKAWIFNEDEEEEEGGGRGKREEGEQKDEHAFYKMRRIEGGVEVRSSKPGERKGR